MMETNVGAASFQVDEFFLDLQQDGSRLRKLSDNQIAECPFPGLRPFKTSEYELFYGRGHQTNQLLSRLQDNHFLAVVGSSGTGKSSLVRAGLIPALFGGRVTKAGTNWKIAICRPGYDPIKNLSIALSSIDTDITTNGNENILKKNDIIEPLLRASTFGVLDANKIIKKGTKQGEEHNLLIIIDQFEELFRFDRKDLKSQSPLNENIEYDFVKRLLQAASGLDPSIYVVITMRSEFLGDCVKFRELPEAINNSQYLVPQLERDQIEKVIEGPINKAGKDISPELLTILINEIEKEKSKENLDQLPILQHALMRTYKYAAGKDPKRKTIIRGDYEEIGTMEKALSWHAQEVLEKKIGDNKETGTDKQLPLKQDIAKVLLQALTDSSTDQKGGRRPTVLQYVYDICKELTPDQAIVNGVINHFRSSDTSFIMPPDNTRLYPGLMLDISHESLMRNWPTLQGWMAEEVIKADAYKKLNDRREQNDVIRGAFLKDLENWEELKVYNNVAWASRYQKTPPGDNNTPERKKELYEANLAYLKKCKEDAKADMAKELEIRRNKTAVKILYISVALIILISGIFIINLFNQKNEYSRLYARYQVQNMSFYNALDSSQKEQAQLLLDQAIIKKDDKVKETIAKSLSAAVAARSSAKNDANIGLALARKALKIDSNLLTASIGKQILDSSLFYQQQLFAPYYYYSINSRLSLFRVHRSGIAISGVGNFSLFDFVNGKFSQVDTGSYKNGKNGRYYYSVTADNFDQYYDERLQILYDLKKDGVYESNLKTKQKRKILSLSLPGKNSIISQGGKSVITATIDGISVQQLGSQKSIQKFVLPLLKHQKGPGANQSLSITCLQRDQYTGNIMIGYSNGKIEIRDANDINRVIKYVSVTSGASYLPGDANKIVSLDISANGKGAVLTSSGRAGFFDNNKRIGAVLLEKQAILNPSFGDLFSKIIISANGRYAFGYNHSTGVFLNLTQKIIVKKHAVNFNSDSTSAYSTRGKYSLNTAMFLDDGKLVTIALKDYRTTVQVWMTDQNYTQISQAWGANNKPYLSLINQLRLGFISLEDVKNVKDQTELKQGINELMSKMYQSTLDKTRTKLTIDSLTAINEQLGKPNEFKSVDYLLNKAYASIFTNTMEQVSGSDNYKRFEQRLDDVANKLTNLDLAGPGNRYMGSTLFASLAWNKLFINDFKGAAQAAKKGYDLYPDRTALKNLALSYLLNQDYRAAEKIYRDNKDGYFSENYKFDGHFFYNYYKLLKASDYFKDFFLADLDIMEKAGKIPAAASQEVKKIRAILTATTSTQLEGP